MTEDDRRARRASLLLQLAATLTELAHLELDSGPANDVPLAPPAQPARRAGRRGPRFPNAAAIEALAISELDVKAAERAARTTGMIRTTRKA